MTISLSEQLESDIKAYLHKTFGTYFSSLDERFAADIKEDVINASDFHHGYYNDDDISIAFQRVTLGRMGHPDWQIYHSCTDTEVNTMKQNVKVNIPRGQAALPARSVTSRSSPRWGSASSASTMRWRNRRWMSLTIVLFSFPVVKSPQTCS